MPDIEFPDVPLTGGSWIKLSDSTGTVGTYSVAYLDWTRLSTIDPNIDTWTDTINDSGTVAYMQLNGYTDNEYWQLGNFQGAYTNPNLSSLISGAIPPDEGGGGLVFFQYADYQNGSTNSHPIGVLPSGARYSECFKLVGSPQTPPNDLNSAPNTYFTLLESDVTGNRYNLITPQMWQPGMTLYRNKNASRYFRTTTGGLIGACIVIGANSGKEIAYVNGPEFLSGYQAGGSHLDEWNFMAYQNEKITGMAMSHIPEGSAAPTYATAGYTGSDGSAYVIGDEFYQDPLILNETSVQVVATTIGGVPKIGLAALKWTGQTITGISVVFYPTWFWGDFMIDPTLVPPTTADQFFGPPQEPARGGSGTYHHSTDVIINMTEPDSPMSYVGTGDPGIHIYGLDTQYHLKNIISQIWSKKPDESILANNTIGSIMSIGMIPEVFYDSASSSGTATNAILLGRNTAIYTDANHYPLHLNSKQYVKINSFWWSVMPFFGNYLDYEGYTTMTLHLPFVGNIDIPPSKCTAKSNSVQDAANDTGMIKVTYRCDIATGNVVAQVICYDQDGRQTAYYLSGNCLVTFPLYGSSISSSEMLGSVGRTVSGVVQGVTGLASGDWAGAIEGAFNTAQSVTKLANPQSHNAVASHFNGNNNIISNKIPYLEVVRPQPAYDDDWVKFKGMSSSKYFPQLGAVYETPDTFTIINYAKADDVPFATDVEKQEIERLLREGVYI